MRRSSPDCQVSASCRFALVIDALRAAPIVPNEFKPIGSSGTTKVILSRADVTPLGNGVAVAAAVGVACGIGVAVGYSWAAAGGVAGASAPPQATNIRVNIAATPTSTRTVSILRRYFIRGHLAPYPYPHRPHFTSCYYKTAYRWRQSTSNYLRLTPLFLFRASVGA